MVLPAALRSGVAVEFADARIVHADAAFGGMWATLENWSNSGTSGWSVRNNSTGVTGVTTAAHCDGIEGIRHPGFGVHAFHSRVSITALGETSNGTLRSLRSRRSSMRTRTGPFATSPPSNRLPRLPSTRRSASSVESRCCATAFALASFPTSVPTTGRDAWSEWMATRSSWAIAAVAGHSTLRRSAPRLAGASMPAERGPTWRRARPAGRAQAMLGGSHLDGSMIASRSPRRSSFCARQAVDQRLMVAT